MNSAEASIDSTDNPADQLVRLSRKPGCTPDEIKAAYLQLAEQLHPDHGGGAEQFQRLQREYEAALTRLKHGQSFSPIARPPGRSKHGQAFSFTDSNRFVRWPDEPKELDPLYGFGAFACLIVLLVIGSQLPPEAMITFASFIASALILVLLPLAMASSKPSVIALMLIVIIPVSLAFFIGLSQSDAANQMTEGHAQFGDIATASLAMPVAATLLALFIGFLFWLAGDPY